ncbi:PD-(D/E)XK motif protein [Chryseobacterium sp. RLHN22]|uniref:PD-(D/E)XK motif protein n=1 Tax=Chryseobacterium sp. RLHN22 TaxID=3437885 RepID=UPI003D9ABDC2
MINYKEIWESINNESKNNPMQSQIARRIPSEGLFSSFLATDFRKHLRILYIKLDSDQDILIDSLPKFRGLEISIIVQNLGEFSNAVFLKLTQSIPNTDNIFELVISDLCDKVIQLKNKNNLSGTLIKTLLEWRIFFEKYEKKILSISAQKGLFGELHFLKDYLFQKYSFAESVLYWTGSDKTTHDFQIMKKVVEIKTTSGKQHKKFCIASEKQLDNTGIDYLYLSLFSVNLHSNLPNCTLPVLIREICMQIQYDPVATFQFYVKLLKYGYNEALADKYTVGFSISESKFFDVKEGFPRLLQKNLPSGVGDLQYSIVVAACVPFEITTDILNYI